MNLLFSVSLFLVKECSIETESMKRALLLSSQSIRCRLHQLNHFKPYSSLGLCFVLTKRNCWLGNETGLIVTIINNVI